MKYVLLVSLIVLAGCTTGMPARKQEARLTLEHSVVTPEKYQIGRTTPSFAGTSPAARYVEAHERGWWACLKNYAKDIEYQLGPGDHTSSGWPAEVDGFQAGVFAARDHMELLIERYGSKKTHRLLVDTFGKELEK